MPLSFSIKLGSLFVHFFANKFELCGFYFYQVWHTNKWYSSQKHELSCRTPYVMRRYGYPFWVFY